MGEQIKQPAFKPIAVIGIGGLFPDSINPQQFWQHIVNGNDLLKDIPVSHWLIEDYYDPDPKAPDKTYCKRGAFLPYVDFNPLDFGIPPAIVPATDTGQLLSLIATKQVLYDAFGEDMQQIDLSEANVIIGTATQQLLTTMTNRLQAPIWRKALRECGVEEDLEEKICQKIAASYVEWQESSFPGLLANVVSGRVANRFNFGGTNCIVDAACAGSLAAMSMAIDELQLGRANLAVTGGSDLLNDILMYMCFSKTPALSKSGDCRPFSASADGTMLGEAVCLFALKRLDDAERDNNKIYAVIRGIGSSSDGRSKSIYAPVAKGQSQATRRAYQSAQYPMSSIGLIEAHGTGTIAGDYEEFTGLTMAVDAEDRKKQHIALGSVKSQIGHTKSTAAAASLFKVVMALHHKILPPTIKVDQPNPKLNIADTPFYLNTATRPWLHAADHPRRASISSFGFGGTNFHVTLEEYCSKDHVNPLTRTLNSELYCLSGDDTTELVQKLQELLSQTLDDRNAFLQYIFDSQQHFSAQHKSRLTIVVTDFEDLKNKVTKALEKISSQPDIAFSLPNGIYYGLGAVPGDVAFLFPGQGSQYVNMGAELALHFPFCRQTWDTVAGLELEPETTLTDVVFPQPVFNSEDSAKQTKKLSQTQWTQAALAIMSLTHLNLLNRIGVNAQHLAGHSFGELVALYSAGVFDANTMLYLAVERGRLMSQSSSTPGAMLAVMHPYEQVLAKLQAWGSQVTPANFNSPDQIVLSGAETDILEVQERFKAEKITAKRLQTSQAFHSPYMQNCLEEFAKVIQEVDFNQANTPVYANINAKPYPHDTVTMREHLGQQLLHPVRFIEQIQNMYEAGARVFIEVGPHCVLSHLVKKILDQKDIVVVNLDHRQKDSVATLWHALGALMAQGVSTNLMSLWQDYLPLTKTPASKSKMTLKINGANYGKPYPPPGGAADLPKPNPARKPSSDVSELTTTDTDKAGDAMTTQHDDYGLLKIYQHYLDELNKAHAQYQQLSKDCHIAFLETSKQVITEIKSLHLGNTPAPQSAVPVSQPAQTQAPASEKSTAATPDASKSASLSIGDLNAQMMAPPPNSVASTPMAASPKPAVPTTVSSPPPPPATPDRVETPAASSAQPQVASVATSASSDQNQVEVDRYMLEIVAEKTGYPEDSLEMSMDLEADLGIDSIKRVEILSVMQEKIPALPELDPAEMGVLRTMGEIADYVHKKLGQSQPSAATAAAQPPPQPETSASPPPATNGAAYQAAAGDDSLKEIESVMLAIVAEKTGYPQDSLEMGMDLEADLGIDSIKRVEILSVMQEKIPALPELDPAEMGVLRTMQEIADYVKKKLGSASEATSTAKITKPARRFQLVETLVPLPQVSLSLAADHMVYITDDASDIAQNLATELSQHNFQATVVKSDDIPETAKVIIYTGGLKTCTSIVEALTINRNAFQLLHRIAAHCSQHEASVVLLESIGGDFGLRGYASEYQVWTAGLSGLAKTAAQEWPLSHVKCVDIEITAQCTPNSIAKRLFTEISQGGDAPCEVGLQANGKRITLQTESADSAPRAEAMINTESVIVVSGGARGVTASCLAALAAHRKPRLVLLGRTHIQAEPKICEGFYDEKDLKQALIKDAQTRGIKISPRDINQQVSTILANRQVATTLDQLQAAGAQVLYFAVDIQDKAGLEKAFQEVREQWGPITGIVHGAGLLRDKLIADKSLDQFNQVFDTKIEGLQNLLALTTDDPLNLICLFSSVAARCGNLGQCDYAMANEVMNKVANRQKAVRGQHCLVKSLNWGPWDAGMVTPELKALFAERNIEILPVAEGVNLFLQELDDEQSSVEVVLGGVFPSPNKEKKKI